VSLRSLLPVFSCLACAVPAEPAPPMAPPHDGARTAPGAVDRAREIVVESYSRAGVELAANELPLRDYGRDAVGATRLRFAILRGGLPVDGGDVVVVLRDGGPAVVSGSLELPPLVAAPARLDAAAAMSAALTALAEGAAAAVLTAESSPRLVALPAEHLLIPAWRVVVGGERDGRAVRREIFVDAASGAIVHQREGLRAARATGSGVGVLGDRRALDIFQPPGGGYQLRDDTRLARGIRTTSAGGGWRLPGKLVVSDDPHDWDRSPVGAGAAVDAHAHGAATVDWLARVLGRDSWDGEGAAIRLVVHFGDRTDNAFWDGRRAVFGDGDGVTSRPYSAALDVVAHEIFHGVIESEVDLIYEEQPGAISESLADVFGALVEAGEGVPDWRIGELVIDRGVRDLRDPAALGLPDHMDGYLDLPPHPDDDMGGVHVNSTIPSHAAALLAEGGRHRRSGVEVPRLGAAAVRDIWWRALTVYLTPRARFAELARATLHAAADLHGPETDAVKAVATAWQAVGVLR
jgi:bacillolysin